MTIAFVMSASLSCCQAVGEACLHPTKMMRRETLRRTKRMTRAKKRFRTGDACERMTGMSGGANPPSSG